VVDLLARKAGPHQLQVLTRLGDRALAVDGAVPPPDHDRRRDADPQVDGPVGHERLEGRRAHRGEHRGAELEREHAGAQSEPRLGRRHGPQQAEGLLARDLGGPHRVEAQLGGRPCRLEPERGPEGHVAGKGHTGRMGVLLRHGADGTRAGAGPAPLPTCPSSSRSVKSA